MGRTVAPFIGREAELSRLRALLAGASEHRPVARAVIVGAPGIGKTRLVDELIASSEERRLTTLHGTCRALDQSRAFAPFVEAAQAGTAATHSELVSLLATSAAEVWQADLQALPPALRFQEIDRVAAVITSNSLRQPILIVVEDLQWADAATIGVLHRLATTPGHARIVMVCTMRPHPTDAYVLELASELVGGGGLQIKVEPLDPSAVHEMTTAILGATPGPRLSKIVDGARGHPLFLTELISALQQDGLVEVRDGVAETPHRIMRPTLRMTLLTRLGFLPSATIELLRVAAVLGRSSALRELALAVGQSSDRVAEGLRDAVNAGLLTDDSERVAFAHDLIRDALYLDMPRSMRRELHRSVAMALIADGATPAAIASQLELAARRGDELAVRWLRAAAAQEARRSPDVAVRLLQRARKVAAPSAEMRHEVEADLTAALVSAGRLGEALRVSEEALLDSPMPSARSKLHRARADALFWSERNREAAAELERAVRGIPSGALQRGRLLAELGERLVADVQIDRGVRRAREAVTIGRRRKDDITLAIAIGTLAYGRLLSGWVVDARRLKRVACGYAQASGDATLAWHERYSGAWYDMHADRFDACEATLLAERARAEAERANWKLLLIARSSILLYGTHGRWRDLERPREEVGRLQGDNDVGMDGATALAMLVAVAVQQDELADARRLMDEADAQGRLMSRYDDLLAATRSLVLEAEGDLPSALRLAKRAATLVERKGFLVRLRAYGVDLVRIAIAADDLALAERVVHMLDLMAARARLPSAVGIALHARGLLARDHLLLHQSVHLLRQTPRRVNLARACEDGGALAGEAGEQGGANLLREARELYVEMDARQGIRHVDRRLREAGVRGGSRWRRRTAISGWESLTEAERRVVMLVSNGLTNGQIADRLFLSRRTVESHLAHAYAKLGASTRVQLAAMAADQ